jgi:hypothetical protein
MIDAPANRRSSDNARDQLRGKPKTTRHGGCPGSTVVALTSLLVSPDLPAATNFGQPLIETSEPCGKRSFVRRFIAISLFPVVRAIRHVVETRYDARGEENCAPSPLKAARTILTASNQVKIAC